MGNKNKYNTVYVLHPITRGEIEAAGLPELPKEADIGGLLFTPTDIERAHHRWLNTDDRQHPYRSDLSAAAIVALRQEIHKLTERQDFLKKEAKQAQDHKVKSDREVQTWIKRNHDHAQEKQELLQTIKEAQALQLEAEGERGVSDTLIEAKEGVIKEKDVIIVARDSIIARYQEKYQDDDVEPLTRWQRFGTWLFGI